MFNLRLCCPAFIYILHLVPKLTIFFIFRSLGVVVVCLFVCYFLVACAVLICSYPCTLEHMQQLEFQELRTI